MCPHTRCIIKGLLTQAINTHTLRSFAGLCHHGNMCVFLSDAAGDCDGCEIWRREQSCIKTSHYFLCVPPGAHERTWGEKLALLILVLILTEMTLYSPSHQRRCDDGDVLVFSDTLPSVCSLTETLACTDSSVLTLHFQSILESFP